MRGVLFYSAVVLGLAACSSEESLTEPGMPAEPSAVVAAAVANSWSTGTAYDRDYGLYGGSAAMAPNAAGEPVVYILGATEEGFDVGYPVRAYNAATDVWETKATTTDVWYPNGTGKIGSRIYFSGGITVRDDFDLSYTNAVWAYDYARDRMIRKADLPIRSAKGVSGVIDNKLYVLPGRCWTEGFPAPGTCSTASTRRFFRYDPVTDRWATRPWAPHFHADGAAGVIDGKLYVVGGASRELDVYDPVTNRWTTRAPIPAAGRAIGAVLGGRFFVLVGSHLFDQQMFEYNPKTNTWRSRARPRWAHDGLVKVTLRGTNYLVAAGGGTGSGNELPTPSEIYTP
jgi:N-acetylneuraminic acid mutarotase